MLKFLKGLLLLLGALIAGCIALFFLSLLVLVGKSLVSDEVVTEFAVETERAVGVLELEGEILSSKEFRKQLKKFVDQDSIKAIVVRIDSPGGAVGASEEIYRAIKRADKKKPVVCSLGNLAASGGMYSAVACRRIVTNRGTLTGSIGVILMSPNVSQLIKNVGMNMTVVKSGEFKDAGSPFRDPREEDRALLQSLVDASYEHFLSAIADGRSLEKEKVRPIADGRVILGSQAVKWGLADQFGGLEDAAQLALELSGDSSGEAPEIVPIPAPTGIKALLSDFKQKTSMFSYFFGGSKILYRMPW